MVTWIFVKIFGKIVKIFLVKPSKYLCKIVKIFSEFFDVFPEKYLKNVKIFIFKFEIHHKIMENNQIKSENRQKVCVKSSKKYGKSSKCFSEIFENRQKILVQYLKIVKFLI